ncbi:winged helix-turn-helix domain-containing protein [Thalassotalea ganghwensis]
MEPFKFGNWHIFPKLNQLTLITNGQTETVTPKIMQLLMVLIEHANEPASVDELISTVWRERVVADSSVYQAIAQLRKVLSQDSQQEVYIERISGQGYRINPDIDICAITTEPLLSQRPWFLIAGLMIIIAALSIYLLTRPKQTTDNQHFESLSLASHLVKQQEPEQLHHAKQLYMSVLQQQPSNVEALNGLCHSYRLLAIYDTMTEDERDSLCSPLLEKAYAIEPDNANILASIGRQAFHQGEMEKSAALFQQALAITAQEALIWHWYGQLKRSQNQIQEALNAHQNAFKLAPNDPIILRGLAYAHLNNRDLNNARKYFERSIVIAPNFKNRALYELDFYPLNQERAKNYLAWYRDNKDHYLKRFPVHRLSYVLFLLSLNQAQLAEEELNKVETIASIPKHFLLYVKASLAWHLEDHEYALTLLKQRYELAPKQHHLVMPYLMALTNLDYTEQALALFHQHFANIVELDNISDKQLGQYLLLAALYQAQGKTTEYQQAYAKLLSLRQEITQFPAPYEVIWHDITASKDDVLPLLNNMLFDGWLPDYNDSMFSLRYYGGLINATEKKAQWLGKLKAIQDCIWESRHCTVN